MVGSKKTRGRIAVMARSAMAQSHSTHNPAINMVAPPPLTTVPPTGLAVVTTAPATTIAMSTQGPVTRSSHLHGTAAKHGGTSHQGRLITTANLGPILEQLQAFPPLPSHSTHTLAYTSNETLARVQLGSTHFSPPDPRTQADHNMIVYQLAQRMDNQSNLIRQLLNQISLAQNLGLGQPGKERRMEERSDRQLDGYQAGRVGVSRQGEGQQRDWPADMSQASAIHTQSRQSHPSRLSLRNNVRKRLAPRLDIKGWTHAWASREMCIKG
ncbi:unnamed protein product [Prunus armeniaca]